MQVDYIIVGLGLAGLAFAEELRAHGKSFVIFEDQSQQSSLVAGGMYNPVILKRFTPVWNAKEQLEIALPFYQQLEEQFQNQYDYKISVLRSFKSIEEQNNWYAAADKPLLKPFLKTPILTNTNKAVNADFGFGEVLGTGRIAVKQLISDYRNYCKENNQYTNQSFDYECIENLESGLSYQNISAKSVVFCEGGGMIKNKYFNYLPLKRTKGELITIYAPELKCESLIKSAVFIMPLGNDYYRVGATFNWEDKTNLPTKEGREELVSKLNTVINCSYKITDQLAGLRPTVIDRRPLLGRHPIHKNLAVLNGLGTRGVMVAPIMAKKLYNYLERNDSLDNEIHINRFLDYFTQ